MSAFSRWRVEETHSAPAAPPTLPSVPLQPTHSNGNSSSGKTTVKIIKNSSRLYLLKPDKKIVNENESNEDSSVFSVKTAWLPNNDNKMHFNNGFSLNLDQNKNSKKVPQQKKIYSINVNQIRSRMKSDSFSSLETSRQKCLFQTVPCNDLNASSRQKSSKYAKSDELLPNTSKIVIVGRKESARLTPNKDMHIKGHTSVSEPSCNIVKGTDFSKQQFVRMKPSERMRSPCRNFTDMHSNTKVKNEDHLSNKRNSLTESNVFQLNKLQNKSLSVSNLHSYDKFGTPMTGYNLSLNESNMECSSSDKYSKSNCSKISFNSNSRCNNMTSTASSDIMFTRSSNIASTSSSNNTIFTSSNNISSNMAYTDSSSTNSNFMFESGNNIGSNMVYTGGSSNIVSTSSSSSNNMSSTCSSSNNMSTGSSSTNMSSTGSSNNSNIKFTNSNNIGSNMVYTGGSSNIVSTSSSSSNNMSSTGSSSNNMSSTGSSSTNMSSTGSSNNSNIKFTNSNSRGSAMVSTGSNINFPSSCNNSSSNVTFVGNDNKRGYNVLFTSSNKNSSTNTRRLSRVMCGSSLDDDDTEFEDLLSPAARWPAAQPKSYRGPRREQMTLSNRRTGRRVGGRSDTTTDGETSGMGSSLDELVESSTESASECSSSHVLLLQQSSLGTTHHPQTTAQHEQQIGSQIYNLPSSKNTDGNFVGGSKGMIGASNTISLECSSSGGGSTSSGGRQSEQEQQSLFLLPSARTSPHKMMQCAATNSNGTTAFVDGGAASISRNKARFTTSRSPGAHSSSNDKTERSSDDLAQVPPLPSSNALLKCPPVKRRGGWPKGRKRKPELPGAKPPKAPLTAYVLFLTDRRKHYNKLQHTHSFGEVTKLIGAEWSGLSREQRALYASRSEQEKRRYRNELQAYRQSHDFQLIIRKKRLKRALSGGNPEDSSDCTDGPEDDAPEELYCSKCDKLFSSLHNKRLHLYGRPHNRAQPNRNKSRDLNTSNSTLNSDYNTDNNTDYNTDNNTDYNTDNNTDYNTDNNTDYNTDNNTDYDDSSTSSLRVHATQHKRRGGGPLDKHSTDGCRLPPQPWSSAVGATQQQQHRSSSTTSPSSSPFLVTMSSPNTSVPATSASEDEELPVGVAAAAGSGRKDRRYARYTECGGGVAVVAIAEEGNDGDQEDGGEDDDAPAASSLPLGSSLASLRAQLAEREQEILRLRAAMEQSQKQRAILQQTLQLERQQQQMQPSAHRQPTSDPYPDDTVEEAVRNWQQMSHDALDTGGEATRTWQQIGSGDTTNDNFDSADTSESASLGQSRTHSQVSSEKNTKPHVLYIVDPDGNDARHWQQASSGDDAPTGSFFDTPDTSMSLNPMGKCDQVSLELNTRESCPAAVPPWEDVASSGVSVHRKLPSTVSWNRNARYATSREDAETHRKQQLENRSSNGRGKKRDRTSEDILCDEECPPNLGRSNTQFRSNLPPLQKYYYGRDSVSKSSIQAQKHNLGNGDSTFIDNLPATSTSTSLSLLCKDLPRVTEQGTTMTARSSTVQCSSVLQVEVHATTDARAMDLTDEDNWYVLKEDCDNTFTLHASELTDEHLMISNSRSTPDVTHTTNDSKNTSCADLNVVSSSSREVIPHVTTISSVLTSRSPVTRQQQQQQLVDCFQPKQNMASAPMLDHDYSGSVPVTILTNVTVVNPSTPLPLSAGSEINQVYNSSLEGNQWSRAKYTVANIPIDIPKQFNASNFGGSSDEKAKNKCFSDKNGYPWPSAVEAVQDLQALNNVSMKDRHSISSTLNSCSFNKSFASSAVDTNILQECDSGLDNAVNIQMTSEMNDHSNDVHVLDAPTLNDSTNWNTPNKKLSDYNIDSDSSTDFLSFQKQHSNGVQKSVYNSTDAEDLYSDTISMNANLNEVSLDGVCSQKEEHGSKDGLSNDDILSISPNTFLSDQFKLGGDHDLLDLNELLGRCLQDDGIEYPDCSGSSGNNGAVMYGTGDTNTGDLTTDPDEDGTAALLSNKEKRELLFSVSPDIREHESGVQLSTINSADMSTFIVSSDGHNFSSASASVSDGSQQKSSSFDDKISCVRFDENDTFL